VTPSYAALATSLLALLLSERTGIDDARRKSPNLAAAAVRDKLQRRLPAR